jgi:phage terminase large subunit-like protein
MFDASAFIQYARTHKCEFYEPYDFQRCFHHAVEGERYVNPHKDKEGPLAQVRWLQAGNQIGKSAGAAMEVAFHATGLYPDWWKGHRFSKAPRILVAGVTNDSTRDVIQNELCGNPKDPNAFGTGSIPKHLIKEQVRKPGVMNAFESIAVTHVSGDNAVIKFAAFEQKTGSFMGIRIDFGWMDEEPPWEVFAQFIRATISTNGKLIITFTPENGLTKVVLMLNEELKNGWAVVRAGWKDAPHIMKNQKRMEQLKDQYPEFELKMRMEGEPFMGSGQVFLTSDDEIKIDPIEIPRHWKRICGIDFGIDHPFAASWIAYDSDTDVVYIYDTYKVKRETPPVHASAINRRGDWIPIVWPHDGLAADKASGKPLADHYRNEGLNLLENQFSNPPSEGQKEGQGGNGVEIGLIEMNDRMKSGRLKVFSTCSEFFEEKSTYHRKDGKLIKLNDDCISASRYAIMSLRFAEIEEKTPVYSSNREHSGGWMGA